MSEWIVYSKDSLTEKCRIKKLEYNGEFLGACNLNVTITSPTPITFEIGDYLIYRGERFEINYDPTVIKESSSGTYGEGFKYENIIFNSLSDELTRCDFLDYVPSDNLIHYSSLPNFSFYADSVSKLAERIKVNLDRIYKNDKAWTVVVKDGIADKGVNISVNSINCWDALALAKSQFGVNFVIKGRTITIGTEGIAIDKLFSYGKGNGLISIERNAESDQKIITRLRAYGSTRNMPESYYKNLGLKVFIPKPEYEVYGTSSATIYIGTAYNGKDMFTEVWEGVSDTYDAYRVKIKLNEVVVTALIAMNEGDIDSYINLSTEYNDASQLSTFLTELQGSYNKIYFESGVNKTAFPYDCREYLDNIPNNMAIRNLMLPSFPDNLDPYIDSDNISSLGVREGTVFFDGSGDLEEIYPSMEGMTAEDLIEAGIVVEATGALDVVVRAEQITDDGVYPEGSSNIPKFTIQLKDIGFNPMEYQSTSGSPVISMKDGMCGAREFEIVSCEKNSSGYQLSCNRAYDESLDLYFPYNDYQISAGDKFVLLNIDMPDVYIQAASQRLLQAATEYLASNDYVRYSYVPKIDNVFMARQHEDATSKGESSIHDTIKEGDLLLFEDTDLGIEGSVIIDTLSIVEDLSGNLIPQYEITLKNEKTVGSIEKIQNQIDSIVSGKNSSLSGGGYNSSQIKSLIQAYGKNYFLRKDADDTAKGVITFEKGLEVGNYESGTLGTGGAVLVDEDGNSVAEFDYLKIRKKAAFTEITVQELKHVGGEIVLSPAAMVCSRVEELSDGWKCFFNQTDSDGNKVKNDFRVNDQARCQTFNLESNTYYWRLVTAIEEDYIVLSKTDYDTKVENDVPKVGDNIVQLGNRTDKDRQAAIILSAYSTDAPSYKQYKGINSYSLDGCLVTKLSPYGNEITGRLDIEAGSTGAGNLSDLPDEVSKAIHIGSVNLLRNSGFTGNYRSEELSSNELLESNSELYSKKLIQWNGNAAVNEDSESVSGYSAVLGTLSQSVKELIRGEQYVVSFKAKGTSLNVICGEFSIEQSLSTSYQKYVFKFQFGGSNTFSIYGDATVCDIKLERGTIATDWTPSPYDNDKTLAEFQAIKYISDAINDGNTEVLGGLILSSMIQLGNYRDGVMKQVNAGVSGIYSDGNDVAFWGGGTFERAIRTVSKFKENPRYNPTNEEWAELANFVVSHGGDVFLRGYIYALGGFFRGTVEIANGRILLNEDGSGQLANGAIRWTPEGIMYRRAHDNIEWIPINTFYVENESELSGVVMYSYGTYFDITAGLGEVYGFPSALNDNFTVSIKFVRISRSDSSALLKGKFRLFDTNSLEWITVNYLTIRISGDIFDLVYNKSHDAWVYEKRDYTIETSETYGQVAYLGIETIE